MAVERKKHYLTTAEYSVLTGPKKSFDHKKATPQKVRTNLLKNTNSDDPTLKEIFQQMIEDFKTEFKNFK